MFIENFNGELERTKPWYYFVSKRRSSPKRLPLDPIL